MPDTDVLSPTVLNDNVTGINHVTVSEEAQQGKYCRSSLKVNHAKDCWEDFLLSLLLLPQK